MEIFNYYLISGFIENKYKIFLFSNCESNWNTEYLSLINLKERQSLNNVISVIYDILINLFKLRKEIDVIHVPYASNSPIIYPVLIIYLFFGIPYNITIHGGGLKSWKPKFVHKYFFKKAECIIAVSKPVKYEYKKRIDKSICVIPPLIPFTKSSFKKNELRKRYQIDTMSKILISIGSIKNIKRCDILLNAFLAFEKEYIKKNKLLLIFVGEGPQKENLLRKVIENGFSKYVIFFGELPYSQIKDIYELADIYVISSIFESKSISLLEAMFNGLTIIGANVSDINNTITDGKTGLLFEVENSKDLKDKMIQVIENDLYAKKLGLNAEKNFYDNFSFDKVLSTYLNVFKKTSR
ncbi:glycosyl transferase group 1 [Methanobacterium lacus]|uniref:Glycosyl transferase group 1 n=1 Tax=Methanobacterium lacus (strain AL-21) TaxID=877455 RepID=F0TBN2_METLA|nr:glycosyltransferase family 4 protein [Methanobacterium lacus]ADZ09109.1 glycosyl transferase group 1 [Methanobacterium lacus]